MVSFKVVAVPRLSLSSKERKALTQWAKFSNWQSELSRLKTFRSIPRPLLRFVAEQVRNGIENAQIKDEQLLIFKETMIQHKWDVERLKTHILPDIVADLKTLEEDWFSHPLTDTAYKMVLNQPTVSPFIQDTVSPDDARLHWCSAVVSGLLMTAGVEAGMLFLGDKSLTLKDVIRTKTFYNAVSAVKVPEKPTMMNPESDRTMSRAHRMGVKILNLAMQTLMVTGMQYLTGDAVTPLLNALLTIGNELISEGVHCLSRTIFPDPETKPAFAKVIETAVQFAGWYAMQTGVTWGYEKLMAQTETLNTYMQDCELVGINPFVYTEKDLPISEVNKACRHTLLQHHPDKKLGDAEAKDMTMAINAACERLKAALKNRPEL